MTLPIEQDKRHQIQVKHNGELLLEQCFTDGLSSTSKKFNDWLVTVSFYIALHHIHTFLLRNNFESRFDNHFDRNNYLKILAQRNRQVRDIIEKYLTLHKLSNLCRYCPCQFHYLNAKKVNEYYTFSTVDLPKKLGI